MKTTIIGGVFFLIPLAVIAILLQKVFELSMLVAAPLDKLIPIERVAGVALANLLAIILILVVCFLAGLIARDGLASKQVKRLDEAMIDIVPGYAVIKGRLAGVAGEDAEQSLFKAVLVHFDDYDQIAFEVEESEGKCTIFLPEAPNARSGSTVIVDAERVTYLTDTPRKAAKLMRSLGRGSLQVADKHANTV